MGHQEHFLSRLSRIDGDALNWALRLYNHAELRDLIMHGVSKLRADRFAIALGPGSAPPHAVLTREGRFVTCLGEGMKPYDLHVIPYKNLTSWEDRMGSIGALIEAPPGAEDFKILEARFNDAGQMLCREDFVAMSKWKPLMIEPFLLSFFDYDEGALKIEKKMAFLSMNKLRKRPIEDLNSYWCLIFTTAALSQLLAMDIPALRRWLPMLVASPMLSESTTRHSRLDLGFRGLWATSKIGPSLLPAYKKIIRTSHSTVRLFEAYAGVVVIGLRHQKVRAEVCKLIHSHSKLSGSPLNDFRAYISGLFKSVVDRPKRARERAQHVGRAAAMAIGGLYPEDSLYHFKDLDDVPEELILPAGILAIGDIFMNEMSLEMYTQGLALVAEAKAEDFYMPRAFFDDFDLRLSGRKEITEHLRKQAEHQGKPRIVKARATPGRNDPCSCDSGRKYKKCCGRK